MRNLSRFFAAAALVILSASAVACTGNATGADDPDTSDEATGQSQDELSRARFTRLRSGPKNTDLKALYKAGMKFEHAYLGVYRFNKAGPEATDPAARHNRIKEVMHRYMCGFFDESIDIGRNSGPNRVKTALQDINISDNVYDQDAEVQDFEGALTDVYSDSKLDVLSGGASGNNTYGEIMGIYDMKNHEVLYFGFTNCGSDS